MVRIGRNDREKRKLKGRKGIAFNTKRKETEDKDPYE